MDRDRRPRSPLKVFIVTPAPAGTRLGNRITALRWQRILRELGFRVRIGRRWRVGDRCDLLVALHATKSAGSIRAFHRRNPGSPIIVALTGTDLYTDSRQDLRTRASLEQASRLVVLQREALRALDATFRRKARVILQSAVPFQARRPRRDGGLRVVALGHLRAIKNPLLAAQAARLLPANTGIRMDHYGSALDAGLARKARKESRLNSRWHWRGERPHAEVSRILASSDVFVQTSQAEGGSSAMAEAIVGGLAILSTRTSGAIGMLGRTHIGFFPPDDASALAGLLSRCERDAIFVRKLRAASRARAPLFTPAKERAAWIALLRELRVVRPNTS